MAAPRPGNPDRGWNDPPVFDYQAAATVQSSPRRHLLNKRVAFPTSNPIQEQKGLNSSPLNPGDGPPTSPVQILPPATNTATPTPVPVLVPSMIIASSPPQSVTPVGQHNNEELQNLNGILERLKIPDDTGLMDFVQQTFDDEVHKCTKLQSRVLEDVKRKLELFIEMWKTGYLSEAVKCRMAEMAEAIKESNYEKAWDIHLGLMVDHITEVNHWLVGIKHIILELKENQSESPKQENICVSSQVPSNIFIPSSVDTETEIKTECGPQTENVDQFSQNESKIEKEADALQNEADTKSVDQTENIEQVSQNEGKTEKEANELQDEAKNETETGGSQN